MKNSFFKLCVAILILVSVAVMNLNLYYFNHYHVDESGNLYVHAHPFQQSEKNAANTSGHTHTQSELQFLSLIYGCLGQFIFINLFILISLLLCPKCFIIELHQLTNLIKLSKSLTRRGPPVLLQSV